MRVAIVSPYSGDIARNTRYLIECLKDSVWRGEYPFAGHLFFTQFLDDGSPVERQIGMMAYREWMRVAEVVAVYEDLGVSTGMEGDIKFAQSFGIPLNVRNLPRHLLKKVLDGNHPDSSPDSQVNRGDAGQRPPTSL